MWNNAKIILSINTATEKKTKKIDDIYIVLLPNNE